MTSWSWSPASRRSGPRSFGTTKIAILRLVWSRFRRRPAASFLRNAMKPRHQFYLDEPIQEQLDRLAAEPGTTRSAIVNAALKSYFANRGAGELDRAFRMRLDRMSEYLERLER